MEFQEIRIDKRVIGFHAPAFVIAEVGINHNGEIERAVKLIDEAAECGADAVKFQTFQADRLMVWNRDRYAQQGEGEESAHEMFRRLELSFEAHEKLKARADRRGISFLSTPFDEDCADFLDTLGVAAFKIASGDLNHLPLLRRVAAKRKPILLSTGMSFLSEVADAVWSIKSSGGSEIVLLHCVSSYPAPPESLNLRAIQTLGEYFNVPVGYSDHSEGMEAALSAVALGARVLEKHFTLDRNDSGPDHKSSMDPGEMRLLIRSLRSLETSLGDGLKRPAEVEQENRRLARRSVVAAVDIRAGQTISSGMLTYKRPGTGLEPRFAERVIGTRAVVDIPQDTILEWSLLSTASPAPFADLPGVERIADLTIPGAH